MLVKKQKAETFEFLGFCDVKFVLGTEVTQHVCQPTQKLSFFSVLHFQIWKYLKALVTVAWSCWNERTNFNQLVQNIFRVSKNVCVRCRSDIWIWTPRNLEKCNSLLLTEDLGVRSNTKRSLTLWWKRCIFARIIIRILFWVRLAHFCIILHIET